jgi:hypothetical protein
MDKSPSSALTSLEHRLRSRTAMHLNAAAMYLNGAAMYLNGVASPKFDLGQLWTVRHTADENPI